MLLFEFFVLPDKNGFIVGYKGVALGPPAVLY
jgi:hypothetical protein